MLLTVVVDGSRFVMRNTSFAYAAREARDLYAEMYPNKREPSSVNVIIHNTISNGTE